MTIADLHLSEPCLSFANRMRSVNRGVVFTSGNRTRKDQARAMAQNLVKDRKYVSVYAHSLAIDRICDWLNKHPHVTDFDGIYAGLVGVLSTLTDDQFSRLTSHANGLAVDILPSSCTRAELRPVVGEFAGAMLSDLPDITVFERGKIIWREGNLERCHVQFRALPQAPVSA